MATLPTIEIEADVAAVFLSYFQRAPEFEAMEWYAQLYIDLLEAQGDDPAAEQNAFKALSAQIYTDGVNSSEVPAGPTVTNEWYVNYLYNNLLGRAPEEAGFEYWVAELDAGTIERPELVGIILASAHEGGGRDAEYVENRTFVAVNFSQWENSNPQILPDLKYNAAEVLIGVNENFDTVVAAQEKLHWNTGQIGETFQLTPGIDTFEGTVLDDTFNAFYEGEGGSTLTNFDTLDGDQGWDVFNIYTDGDSNTFVPGSASIMNVEEINIFNSSNMPAAVAGGNKALTDASAYQGVRELWQIDNAMSVLNLGAETVAGFENLSLTDGEGGGVANVNVQATNGATQANIALLNVEGNNDHEAYLGVSGNALDTVNVFGFLADEDDVLMLQAEAGDDVAAVTLNTDVTTFIELMSANDTAITTLDASGSEGDVWFEVGGDTRNVTTGLGDDVIIFGEDADGLPSLFQNIDGGEGFDVAALGATRFQTQDYDAINQMQNIEGLVFYHPVELEGEEIPDLAGEDNPDVVQLDAAQVANFGMLVFGNPLSEGALHAAEIRNLSSDQTLAVAKNDAGILLLHDAAADVTVGVAEGAWAAVEILEGGLGATGGTLTLLGDGLVDVSNVVDEGTAGKFATIDASMLGGDLEVEEMAAGFVETVLLGASSDAVTLTMNEDGSLSSTTKGATDVIVNFTSTGPEATRDMLWIEAEAEKAVVEADVSGANTLNQAFAAAAENQTDLVFFLWEGDTYLFANTGTDAGYDNSDFTLLVIGEHDFEEPGLIGWDVPPVG